MNLNDEESLRIFASPSPCSGLRLTGMTLHPVIARHDSAEAISDGLLGKGIATLRSQ